MKRYAITGPESSGKTTLAHALANEYDTNWVAEYAREYLMRSGGTYEQQDLDLIASGQVSMWEISPSNSMAFFDTEMTVMKVWSEYKYGTVSDHILHLLSNQQFDHYFLCRPDIMWEEDPLREHPEERDALFEIYVKELTDLKVPYTIVGGSLPERVAQCLVVINA
jgi:NadR type nicotinamide-nucleotide adenylyltransferase